MIHYKDKFVGIRIYGYCDGYFGRDSYGEKVIIASGEDWVVANDWLNNNEFASFEDSDDMEELIQDWSEVNDD